jgi:hypothetical protein
MVWLLPVLPAVFGVNAHWATPVPGVTLAVQLTVGLEVVSVNVTIPVGSVSPVSAIDPVSETVA